MGTGVLDRTEAGEGQNLADAQRVASSGEPADVVAFVRAVHFADPAQGTPYYAEAAACLNDLLHSAPTPSLMVLAAWMLTAGQGYAADPKRARAMLDAAASADDSDAHFELYAYDARGIGGTADPLAAIRHLRRAAQLGNARAMANLGGMYATGAGVTADQEMSIAWYRRAADSGDARAAFNLAIMFSTGQGAPADPRLAQKYRRLAEAAGLTL